MGGLSRRATIITENPSSIVVEVGGSLLAPGGLRGDAAVQNRIKARLIAESLAAVRLDVMTVASTDWALGAETVMSWVAELGLPVLAANLQCNGSAPFPGYKIVESHGKKLGFVGITAGQIDGCVLFDAARSIDTAVAAMGEVDVRILLLPKPIRSISGVTNIDVVLSTNRGALDVGNGGSIEALTLQNRGKKLGKVTLTFAQPASPWNIQGSENEWVTRRDRLTRRLSTLKRRMSTTQDVEERERLIQSLERVEAQVAEAEMRVNALTAKDSLQSNTVSFEDIALDRAVQDHPVTQRRVQAALERIAQQELGAHANTFFERVADANSVFLGADGCAGCHPNAMKQWLTTGHAKAMTTLITSNHQADRDCVPCHSTGYGAPRGPQNPAEIKGLRDVQCEACHGPGRDHATSPKQYPMTRIPNDSNCIFCHDGERDEGRFNKETYWPKIVHSSGGR